jgi:AbiU2
MKTALNDDIESGLAAISDALANASTCFDVWREMQDGNKRQVYEPVVADYPIFFETTVIAHLIAMSTLLYPILETRRDTHNIPGLVRTMLDAKMDAPGLSSAESQLAELRPAWAKLARVRNEVFGHRSNSRFPVQVFAEIRLHPDEIGGLIEQLKEVIRDLARIANTIVSHALTLSATEDTQRLMLDLAKRGAL